MQFDNLNFNEDNGLMSIEDLRALRFQKQKIENDKKARKYIKEILQILNNVGLFAFNLFSITIFTLPTVIFMNLSLLKKLVSHLKNLQCLDLMNYQVLIVVLQYKNRLE